mmetsp:Transcript_6573/g.9579  ORF Transcript_6573/g.9579 Transcript_6573/m.9579 type:complete len:158 (-) Transcript_6573:80-553(-)|eukprot:CAMPEP_0195518226 /NCGR_PEP_ID=MMETSP0794_2-20130614/12616_1 /TAXON_ID=515487 /ORGANISM="Stephanopyxis turris, Strain CCMP 815" /LENGTH=157 /DNA_ID=CAMNT_0040647161 /DNA_START=56 /DNA_END=529 /DNA_ORIENTATION=-
MNRRWFKKQVFFLASLIGATDTRVFSFSVTQPLPSNKRAIISLHATPELLISAEEEEALRSASSEILTPVANDNPGWFDREAVAAEIWTDVRVKYPILAERSDSELRSAYLNLSPTLLDVITKTPVGPFVFINLIFLLSGFSWCDTPFANSDACPVL